jgi:hypothetical protein
MVKKTSAAQKRAQNRMKKAMKIAKSDYKAHPNKKWKNCVKQAWKQV